MTKISVILPTNKINSENDSSNIGYICKDVYKKTIFNEEFTKTALINVLNGGDEYPIHILEPTLNSLSNQSFDDFEVLLCHKYPDDAKGIISKYKSTLDIKLIKEKPSIWHDLGNYPTVNNIRNTGLIHANGELILFLDDNTIFSETLLDDMWNSYKSGYYGTAKSIRRIKLMEEPPIVDNRMNRKVYYDNKIYGVENFSNNNIGDIIPVSASWTYCCSVSLNDCLSINGFDELYDGNFGGTDEDFGLRLGKVSNMKRKIIGNIYEFDHESQRQKYRDDNVLRRVCKQFPIPKHIRANLWKPTNNQLKRFENYHKLNDIYLDKNWKEIMNSPLYELEEER